MNLERRPTITNLNMTDLAEKYDSYARRIANRYSKAYGVDYEDLYQEGILSLITTIPKVDTKKAKEQIDSYLKKAIQHGVLKYVAFNHSDVKANKNKFFKGETFTNAREEEADVVLTGMNPEDLYILFEDRAMLDEIFDKFLCTMDEKERFVWDHVVRTHDPLTTREAAAELGVKSNRTITNIRKRLEDRFDSMYRGELN
jgi:RNA polymerase sigma factor (sigma-70 family)